MSSLRRWLDNAESSALNKLRRADGDVFRGLQGELAAIEKIKRVIERGPVIPMKLK